ncbi:MAG: S8 family serine peptidase [Candidatus Cybelea sp.]
MHPLKLAAQLVAVFLMTACNGGGSSNVSPLVPEAQIPARTPEWQATGAARAACPLQPPPRAHCDALLMNGAHKSIAGWQAADFLAAYNLPPASKGSGELVAVVDAYDNPNAAADLAAYRAAFHLGSSKFAKYNQKGQKKNYPATNSGWGLEEDLDIEMVAAVCPKCTIYLFEAQSDFPNDLQIAELSAVRLGAHIVSNSWGCGPGSNGCVNPEDFAQSDVTYVASAGDYGYGAQAPASLDTVVAVGGTVLGKNGSQYSENVWRDSGAGCSDRVKPAWQSDPSCPYRTMNDVAAVAKDAAEYDSFHHHGWILVSGTSVSAPLIAGIFGVAGDAAGNDGGERFWNLSRKHEKKYLHEITTGLVSGCPAGLRGTYLCSAGTGQDGGYSAPAGWGTPNGTNAF